jgi:hypothetical protein
LEFFVKRLVVIGLVGLFSMSALVACGSDSKNSSTTQVKAANAQFCTDLAAYGSSLATLESLNPTSATKADYTTAAGNVKSAREALVTSGKDLANAEWTNLQTQTETLTGQLKDAPDDVTVSSIVTGAATQIATVKASAATLNTAVCATSGATSSTVTATT